MQFKSKNMIIGVAVALALFIGYVSYAMSSNAPADGDPGGWALLMLKFIAVCVIAEMAAQALVYVAFTASVASKEKDERAVKKIIGNEMVEDEMDRHITLRSSHAGYGVAGAGFVFTLVAIAFLDASATFALNILMGAFFLSAMVAVCVSVYMYEAGGKGCRDCV